MVRCTFLSKRTNGVWRLRDRGYTTGRTKKSGVFEGPALIASIRANLNRTRPDIDQCGRFSGAHIADLDARARATQATNRGYLFGPLFAVVGSNESVGGQIDDLPGSLMLWLVDHCMRCSSQRCLVRVPCHICL